MRARNWLYSLLFVGILLSFFFRSFVTEDPDFGWHIQTGKIIAQQGIPVTDPFSYTMPSYYFVDHEWLADVILAKTYDVFGIVPLHIFFAGIGLLTILLLFFMADKKWTGVLLFLCAGTLLEFIGIRMQVLSWLFLAVEVSIIYKPSLWNKYKYTLPLIFLLWANIHGGFAIGYVVLAIAVIGKFVEEHTFKWSDYVVLLLSGIATCINPYGYALWIEVAKSATDTSLRWTIQEWYPAIYFTNIAFWIYFMISGLLMFRYRKKFSKTVLLIYILLLLSGLASMRNLPIFVIISFYPTLQAILYLAYEASQFKFGKERFAKAYTFFFVMSCCLFIPQLTMFFYGAFIQEKMQSGYPYAAVSYLKNHIPTGNIFASYDIGGFLIWQLPEKKVFIDGRMPSWKNESASPSESTYAFREYRNILSNKVAFEEVSEKYGIDTVLFPIDELEKKEFRILGINVDKSAFLKRFFTNELSFSYLTPQLKKLGWREIYRDKQIIIYQKAEKGS